MNHPMMERHIGEAIPITIEPCDLTEAKCGNRRSCVIAQAIARTLDLNGDAHIEIDANHMAFSQHGLRHDSPTPRNAAMYLKRFDTLSAKHGVEVARTMMKTRVTFLFVVRDIHVVVPKSEKAKATNRASHQRLVAARVAQGLPANPRPQSRYAGI